jgi:hypothetical protein
MTTNSRHFLIKMNEQKRNRQKHHTCLRKIYQTFNRLFVDEFESKWEAIPSSVHFSYLYKYSKSWREMKDVP